MLFDKLFMTILVIAAALPKRMSFGFTSLSILDLIIFFGFIAFGFRALFSKIRIGDNRIFILLMVPFTISILSVLWARNPLLTLEYITKLAIGLMAYLLPVNYLRNASLRFMKFLWVVFSLGLLAGPLGFLLGVQGFEFYSFDPNVHADALFGAYARLSHPFIGVSNDFAPILEFTSLLLFGLGIISKSKTLICFGWLLLLALFLTLSRGVLLSFFLGVTLLAFYYSFNLFSISIKKIFRALIGVTVISFLIVFILFQYRVEFGGRNIIFVDFVFGERLSGQNLDARLIRFNFIYNLILENSLLGLVGGNFAPFSTNSQSAVPAAHNAFLQNILFFGLFFGLLVNLSYIGLLLRFISLSSSYKKLRVFTTFAATGFFILLLSMLTQTFMEATIPRILILFMLGLFTATFSILKRSYPVSTFEMVF